MPGHPGLPQVGVQCSEPRSRVPRCLPTLAPHPAMFSGCWLLPQACIGFPGLALSPWDAAPGPGLPPPEAPPGSLRLVALSHSCPVIVTNAQQGCSELELGDREPVSRAQELPPWSPTGKVRHGLLLRSGKRPPGWGVEAPGAPVRKRPAVLCGRAWGGLCTGASDSSGEGGVAPAWAATTGPTDPELPSPPLQRAARAARPLPVGEG